MGLDNKYAKTYSASGGAGIATTVFSGQIKFYGFLLGMDGTNPQTVTVYDNTEASGNEPVPTNEYDATLKMLNGAMMPGDDGVHMQNGIHLVVEGSGAVDVTLITNNPDL